MHIPEAAVALSEVAPLVSQVAPDLFHLCHLHRRPSFRFLHDFEWNEDTLKNSIA